MAEAAITISARHSIGPQEHDGHYLRRHMATTGGDLVCQACHTTTHHKIAEGARPEASRFHHSGQLFDIRLPCHKNGPTGHSTTDVNKHVGRVACQTCHIPTYAKNASDTVQQKRRRLTVIGPSRVECAKGQVGADSDKGK